MDLPQRKAQRLKGYDYSQSNAYFITICTQNRLPILGRMERDIVELSEFGKVAEEKFVNIANETDVFIDKYVFMPNHIHTILTIGRDGTTRTKPEVWYRSFPTVSEMIRRFKTVTTTAYIHGVKSGAYPPFDKKIWQKSFYDHVIRDEKGYLDVWQYIDENPLKWQDDELLKNTRDIFK